MNNVFNTPAFSMAALTSAINIIPNRYGRMEALNLFPAKPKQSLQPRKKPVAAAENRPTMF